MLGPLQSATEPAGLNWVTGGRRLTRQKDHCVAWARGTIQLSDFGRRRILRRCRCDEQIIGLALTALRCGSPSTRISPLEHSAGATDQIDHSVLTLIVDIYMACSGLFQMAFYTCRL